MQPVQFAGLTVGGGPLLLIAGPCVIESESHAIDLAIAIRDIARRVGVPYVFKASYDKANRTSGRSFRGPGLEAGLRILSRVRERADVPILTDIHEAAHAAPVAEVADVLQIPAFLSRQTDLLEAAARTNRVVNLKKGQFLAPTDIRHAIEKITAAGNEQVIVTERGFTFGYHNLVVDMRAFPIMRAFGYPVVYDVTHSLQLPGAGDGVTAGQAEFIEPMASAGVAAGVDGVFLEVHEQPSKAKSDAQNALRLDLLEPLLERLVRIHAIDRAVRRSRTSSGPVRVKRTLRAIRSGCRGNDGRHPGAADMSTDTASALDLARKVLRIEAAAILGLVDRVDGTFERAVQLLYDCRGRVIVTGMGKSGIICRKIAATLSSTGTAAWFLHPAEATHGDLGAIRDDDVVIALSHSGETEELVRLLESIRRLGARLIAITGDPASTLARAADVTLDCSIAAEACPMNLVPTASTTAALAMGDALAMTLLVRKGFREDQFASLHPAGKLGRRLMQVENVMVSGAAAPIVQTTTPMPDVFHEMSSKRLGMTAVTDAEGRLVGVFTDGDLRRLMSRSANVLALTAGEAMTPNPITIGRGLLAVEALRVMETHKITSVIVIDPRGAVEGVVHLHDLWRLQMF